MRRRLLQRLQQRVERRFGEHVHFVDDVDLGARRNREIASVLDDLAHVVDAGMRSRVHLDDVDVAGFDDRLTMQAQLGHFDAGTLDLARQRIIEGAGQNARGRRLADAAHARQDVGLMDAVGGEGVGERAHHRILADEIVEARGPVFPRQHSIWCGSGRGGGGPHVQPEQRLVVQRDFVSHAMWESQRQGGRLDKDPPWLVRAASFRT